MLLSLVGSLRTINEIYPWHGRFWIGETRRIDRQGLIMVDAHCTFLGWGPHFHQALKETAVYRF